jgi:hypothetical protein
MDGYFEAVYGFSTLRHGGVVALDLCRFNSIKRLPSISAGKPFISKAG